MLLGINQLHGSREGGFTLMYISVEQVRGIEMDFFSPTFLQ